jgi:hypothetical protein
VKQGRKTISVNARILDFFLYCGTPQVDQTLNVATTQRFHKISSYGTRFLLWKYRVHTTSQHTGKWSSIELHRMYPYKYFVS